MKRPALLILTALTTLASCSRPEKVADPAAVAADRDRATSTRLRAIDTLATGLTGTTPEEHAQRREALKTLAWGRRENLRVRNAAVLALLEDDDADTRKMLGLMLPTERSPEMIRLIADLAVERSWRDLTAPLIRSWARPFVGVASDARPEPPALEKLYPGTPLEDVVFSVFATPAPERDFGEKERRAAWEVLGMLDPTGAATASRVEALPPMPHDALVAAVQESARTLGAVPVTKEQLAWLTQMREPASAAFLEEATSLIAKLTPEQRRGLGLRHAAALVAIHHSRPELLGATREELVSVLRARLGGRPYHARAAEGGSRGSLAESFAQNADRLSFGDLLQIIAIDTALEAPATREALFAHADRDRADTSTEHGGVLAPVPGEPGAYAPILYPPRPTQRRGDKRFIAAPEMFTQNPDALAHFHFHVQTERNARYAGPGPGDKQYARIYGRACVVFTSLDADRLAVDYYQPDGTVIDLGEIARPPEAP